MQASRTSETQGNHDLFDAFAQPGCPVCHLSLRAVSQYMNSTNYDALGDPAIRAQFEASLGFCNPHAHQWLDEAFVLGTAQMFRDVIRSVEHDLKGQSFRGGGLAGRRASLLGGRDGGNASTSPVRQPTRPCPACDVLEETESRLIRTLVKGLAEEQFRTAYAGSNGLCLPHLRTALSGATRQEAFDSLKARALATQEILLAHLDETIRKHDYRFQHEPAAEEKGSPERAVAFVAGDRGITGNTTG
ncbi:MAG: DUF6062 family protein, partial [Chloroflexota bacterium]|nr:DUF6062 family protein [Chloroflexota bacterium]